MNAQHRRLRNLLPALALLLLAGLAHGLGGAPSNAPANTPNVATQRARLQAEAQRLGCWQLGETENFFLLTDVHNVAFVDELKQRLEAIQHVFAVDFPTPRAPTNSRAPEEEKSLVRLFKQRRDYLDHGGPPGSAGFWSPTSGELVLHAQRGEAGRQQTWSTLNHEAFHQYIFVHLGEATPHAWFGEGFGDYYGRYRFINGSYQAPEEPFDHPELRAALESGDYADLRDFIHWTKGEYYGTNDLGLSRSLAYAEGCSLIHFLRAGAEAFPRGWQDHWEDILPRYQETFARTGKPQKALKAAFEGVNLVALENCWKSFQLHS